ncbi:zinc finger protein 583-like [Anabrus simplex]|uniref:zinc finger protein 583-like n=1 Tax=Anabrus simplex TaxID=316456 RepID=UPI0035A3CB12
MDMEIEIKEEPVWCEGTANTLLENLELVSEMVSLKQETKSELTEPDPTQENAFETSADIKEETLVEQEKVDLRVPYMKENVDNVALLTKHVGEEVIYCTVCKKLLSQESNLKSHKTCHSEVRHRVCNICNCTFTPRNSLRSHMVIHSGERRLQCEHCSKVFINKRNLRVHMMTHTAEKPFQCEICRCMVTPNGHTCFAATWQALSGGPRALVAVDPIASKGKFIGFGGSLFEAGGMQFASPMLTRRSIGFRSADLSGQSMR